MIKSFKDKRTAYFAAGGRVGEFQQIQRQIQRRLRILHDAEQIEDLMKLPSNHFESLSGDRATFFSIRINDRWRICFSFQDGDAYNVEIVDYH